MPHFQRIPLLLLILILISACANQSNIEPESPVFQHDFTASAVPWTSTDFDNETGKFTFAVFSDLTGGERADVFAVSEQGTDVANLRLSGIFDKTGNIPLNGNELCLEGCAAK